ncbi:MAG: hypothetical protein N2448_00180 [Caloramator sp.]|nr:hypothetical protein [Caloramator sp.]
MVTIKEFFSTATDILLKEREHGECTYIEAIKKAEEKFGITHDELKKICGVVIIDKNSNKK